MIPQISPYGLIQESLWPNEWYIIVSCMMLNCTSRKQVDKVLPEFIKRWPTPELFLQADRNDVTNVVASLGFKNRRTDNLIKMTSAYVKHDWTHVSELPGVGEYCSRSWEIFCQGKLGVEPPKDHALVKYFSWKFER